MEMDVLSEVLRVVKLEGALFFNAEFTAPWCLASGSSAMAPYLAPAAGNLIIYHFLTEGRAFAELFSKSEKPRELRYDILFADSPRPKTAVEERALIAPLSQ